MRCLKTIEEYYQRFNIRIEKNIENLNMYENDILNNEQQLNGSSRGSENYQNILDSLGEYYYRFGKTAYLLNMKEKAKQHFTLGCQRFSELNKYKPWTGLSIIVGVGAWPWIECAILSEDTALKKQCGRELLDHIVPPDEKINPMFTESMMLCYYLIDDIPGTILQINDFKEKEEAIFKSQWAAELRYKGRPDMLKAIIDKDKHLFLDNCHKVNTYFKRRYRKGALKPITLEVIKYLVLAREAGIEFDITDFEEKDNLRLIFYFFF